MIWSPSNALIVIDLAILAIVASVFVAFKYYGMFHKGHTPRTARALIIAGIAVTGLFHLIDLSVMVALPEYLNTTEVAQVMTYLHLDVRWYTSVLSLVLICVGVIKIAAQRQRVETLLRQNSDRADRAQREIAQSELRFRSLIEQTTDAVYCLEFDPPMSIDLPALDQVEGIRNSILVECNQVFAGEVGIEPMAAVLGRRFCDIGSQKDTPSHRQFFNDFIVNEYRLKPQEIEFVDQAGRNRAFRVSFTGVIKDNALVRIWGTEIDVLDQRRVNADLIDRRIFEAFVADISSRLISGGEARAEEALVDCMGSVCHFLKADRTTIFLFGRDNGTADVAYYWNEHGGPPWVEFSIETFPWVGSKLLAGESVRVSALDQMPAAAATDVKGLRQLGLKSVVAVPLAVSKDALGVLAFGNISDERDWSEHDLQDIRVFADLFANVVVQINSREALDAALEELRLTKERLEAENVYLRQEISSSHGFDEICGESPQLKKCLHQVQQVAGTTTTVLIQGATGTGKELIARAIHERSLRVGRPLVKVNCAALPANLIESELFGHEKGAFTGAHSRKRGRFDLADRGTLFLDEIGDFPLELQGKLLRVIQEGEFQRLGGTETIEVDVRLIAATNRNLQKAVDNGEFRADLYYRINTFPINLPTLAERDGDIPILAQHIAKLQSTLLGKEVTAISAPMMTQLVAYSWPGNVRELESVIQRALISSDGPVLELPEPIAPEMPVSTELQKHVYYGAVVDLSIAERSHIEHVLGQVRWVIGGAGGAAEKLGIPPSTLRSKMKKLGINRPSQTG